MRHAALIGEDFAGMRAQGRGLAERAGMSWSFHPVLFDKNRLRNKLPVALWYAPLAQIVEIELPQQTDLIIGLGGRGGAVSAALGRRFGLPVVQVQHPRCSLKDFRLLIVNDHDLSSSFYTRHKEKIISTRTALHPITPELLWQSKKDWQKRYPAMREDFLGVLLGGDNGRFAFGQEEADHLLDRVKDFIRHHDMDCLITPSRRTSPALWVYLKEKTGGFPIFFLEGEGENNPYLGLLACAACLAVTTDSVSMISEAVATTAPVGILPLKGQSKRIHHFITTLKQTRRIEDFHAMIPLSKKDPLDDTSLVATEMLRRLNFL